ncbi:site-specific DNA-methyltransferase [Vibrio parahaemolyticus]|nr:site-specific DNA-methyltransferase [Vibrio parahaemolyticus]EKQ5898133.1 site-specific DNA-methyltransferase [Vibrio parahaemolyticus]
MRTHTLNDGKLTLVHADCLKYLPNIPDNSIDLIVTDPPYFKVKRNAWDNQWSDEAEFLAWLDDVLLQFWRVLKPNGSMYLFCSSKLASDTEILVRQRFEVLSHIVWAKPSGPWNKMHKPDMRKFFPSTERIIFAGHYGSEGFAKGSSGYAGKCSELKQTVFKPLMDYFINARAALDISAKEINKATGTQMSSHWFSTSQWALPNRKQYEKLQRLFQSKADVLNKTHGELVQEYGELKLEYDHLRKDYDDLKTQYQHLRRPFFLTAEVPFTDVWQFGSVQTYPGKHPCEKPADLLEHAITTSSREGAVVLDAFMGGGSGAKVCQKLGRVFIGIEMEDASFNSVLNHFENDDKAP